MQSSTGTLTVRVCTCDRDGNMELCNAEALSSSPGLSTGAIIAILLCAIILLSKCVCNVSTSTSCQLNDYSIMVTAVSIFPYHAAASRFPVDHKLLRVFHPGDGPIFHCKHAHLIAGCHNEIVVGSLTTKKHILHTSKPYSSTPLQLSDKILHFCCTTFCLKVLECASDGCLREVH